MGRLKAAAAFMRRLEAASQGLEAALWRLERCLNAAPKCSGRAAVVRRFEEASQGLKTAS